MLSTIIIEDEVMARRSLEKLAKGENSLNVTGSFESALEAIDFIENNEVEVIFLDIEMPGMTGLELLDKISYMPQIVFTTSNEEYAYEAYEYDVIDFLKKPVNHLRFSKAIQKINAHCGKLNEIAKSSSLNELYVKSDGKLVRLPYLEILYFENIGDYVKVISQKGNYVIHGTLKSIDRRIKNPRFLKVHRSFIVNLDHIKDIEDNTLVIERKVIPISRAHKPILLNSINLI